MTRLLRTSERTTFASCRHKWFWAYEKGLRPKMDAPALRFGSLIHKALELRYPPGLERGPHPAKTFRQLYIAELREQERFGFRDEDGNWQEAGELGIAMLREFVREFGRDLRYEVIASEQTFSVPLTPYINYVGTFDGIWKDRETGQLLLKEWKTAAQFWDRHLPLDEQAGSYWAFAPEWLATVGLLPEGTKLHGILYTFLRKAMPDDRPKNAEGHSLNKDGSVSKRQPTPLFSRHLVYRDRADRENIKQRAKAQAKEMEMIRRGRLLPNKSPSFFNCRGCPFIDPCELHEAGRDYHTLLSAAYEQYDQYQPYEIANEGK